MNTTTLLNNIKTTELFTLLTSSSWDDGCGKKMLFLKRRYYVFDNEHTLIDGGVIRYNETLDKIFIRNEDIRGEVFVTLKDEQLHLKGSVQSILAGTIIIDTHLISYDKKLEAPLSRVAKVENYFTPPDIYLMLMNEKVIDPRYLEIFKNNLHFFSLKEYLNIYIKISQIYFQTLDREILRAIAYFFSEFEANEKIYEEMFMFIMSMQLFYEKKEISEEDITFFIFCVEERLLNAYNWESETITANLINEVLFYFNIQSNKLPSIKTCVQKIFDKDIAVQREYAFYLTFMDKEIKPYEVIILKRLVAFFEMDFFLFKKDFSRGEILELETVSPVSDRGTLVALIQVLGDCRCSFVEAHLFLIFLITNFPATKDENVLIQELSVEALYKAKNLDNTLANTQAQTLSVQEIINSFLIDSK